MTRIPGPGPNGGMLIRSAPSGRIVEVAALPSAHELVADWYVDEQDITGNASDDPDHGTTAAAPLASYRELSNRIAFATLRQDTTIHLLSDCNDDSQFVFRGVIHGPSILRIVGEATQQLAGPLTLTAVQNIVVNASRPSIQVAGVDWNTAGPGGTSLVRKRGRVSSSAGAQVDALFWIQEIDSVDPSIAYISRPFEATPPAFGASRNLAVGDQVVFEELTKAGLLNINYISGGIYNFASNFTLISIEHIRGPGAGLNISMLGEVPGDQGITAYGCDLSWARLLVAFFSCMACQLGNQPTTTTYLVVFGEADLAGCSVVTPSNIGLALTGQGMLVLYNSTSFTTHLTLSKEFGAPTVLGFNDVSFWNWAAVNQPAITVRGGAQLDMNNRLWGVSATAGTYALKVDTNGHAEYPGATLPSLTGAAAHDFDVGGVTDVWASLPVAGQNPGVNNAWLVPAA